MATRIATFNVENLFSRAKILNLQDNEDIGTKLDKVNELQKLIEKTNYSDADKTKILQLYTELKQYVEIEVDRGSKFFNQAETKVTAKGSKDFDGGLVFRRARFSEMAREATGKVIKAVKADVQCIVEAEDRLALERFDTDVMNNHFKYAMLIDGNDPRGIDVGLYSKLPIGSIRSHIYDVDGSNRKIFSRDCPEFEVKLPSGESLWVLVNHLKSKGYGSQVSNDARCRAQAQRIAEILQGYDLANDYVIIAGDLNDTPPTGSSSPLYPLLSIPELTDVLIPDFPNPADRWTYWYSGQGNQIDYLLMSDALKAKFVKAGIERRGIFKIDQHTGGAVLPFPEVTTATTSASDHAAVWAEFNL